MRIQTCSRWKESKKRCKKKKKNLKKKKLGAAAANLWKRNEIFWKLKFGGLIVIDNEQQ